METEIWRSIGDYDNFYEISSRGNIRRMDATLMWGGKIKKWKGRILKQRIRNGYLAVCLCKDNIKKAFSIHRLVAETFIPNISDLPQVNHKNGIKTDNIVENLEWVSCSDNIKHSFRHGISNVKCGEENHSSRFSIEDILEMKRLYETREMSVNGIAKKYGCNRSYPREIFLGIKWKKAIDNYYNRIVSC